MNWPFGRYQPLQYGLILADPPWSFKNFSAKGHRKGAHHHYTCMSASDLDALPVGHLAAPDCLLIMWATWPMLLTAILTMRCWGFTYKTGGVWSKLSKTGTKQAFGTGYVLRSACEPFLLGTIGTPKYCSRSVRNIISAPVRDHSRKPAEMRIMARKMLPDVRAIELFGREPWDGCDVWGNETAKFGGTDGTR